MNAHIPAGMLDANVEFFAQGMRAYCVTSGRVLRFDEFGWEIRRTAEAVMLSEPRVHAGVLKLAAITQLQPVEQFLVCNYGCLDHMPDMVDGKLQKKEYWPCPLRGTCKLEGVVCDGFRTKTGAHLTRTELLVTRLIAGGMLDKEIAAELHISKHTVATHTLNIRTKLAVGRKADITAVAINNHLYVANTGYRN